MANFKQHILAQPNVAGAVCENGGIAVIILKHSGPVIWRGVGDVMNWNHRDELRALMIRACAKLGFKPDRRCITGWRFVGKA